MHLEIHRELILELSWARKLHALLLSARLSDKQSKLFDLFKQDCDEYYRLLADCIRGDFKYGMDELDLEAQKIATNDRIHSLRAIIDTEKKECLIIGVPLKLVELTDPL